MSELEFTNDNFEKSVINSDIPVLVDFWAESCKPCKMLFPIISEMADKYSGKIKIGKVDIGQYPELAGRFGIRTIPSLFFFKNGELVDQFIGLISKKDLENKIEGIL